MIVITGALGFIGSCLIRKLNDEGLGDDLMAVDDFYKDHKEPNLLNKRIREWIHRDIFLELFEKMHSQVDFVFHLGARTDTVSEDNAIFEKLNVNYSKAIWEICTQYQIPLVYASSAATYGNPPVEEGSSAYSDDHDKVGLLKPLNAYAKSKQTFDQWVLQQVSTPPFWAGLKFFNVYGPNEYHKNRMASVAFHAFKQIQRTGEMTLFKSHRKDIQDGYQQRDFIYVKDVVNICWWLYKNRPESGIYNVGTGESRTFLDLVKAVCQAMDLPEKIEFVDTPKDIRKNYQYFTQASMSKLREAGYDHPFTSLEDGIEDYVKNYLPRRVY